MDNIPLLSVDIEDTLNLVIFVVLSLFSMTFIGIVWSKYPQFDDPHFIRRELKMTFVSMTIAAILVVMTIILWMFCGCAWQWTFVVAQYAFCWFMYLMIVYPKRKVLQHKKVIEMLATRMGLQRGLSLNEIHFDARTEWEDLISTKHGYDSFANFLAEQFSVELSMLAERLQDNTRNDTSTVTVMEERDDGCSECTPNPQGLECFYGSMKALYQKYIEFDCAPLEINISSRKRRKISEVFSEEEVDAKNMKQILEAMALAADEIVSLLTGAAIRHSSVSERKKTEDVSEGGGDIEVVTVVDV